MGAWRQDGLADSYVGRNVTLTLTLSFIQGGPAPRPTGRQTVGRNVTWNWTSVIALQITDPSSRQRGCPTSTSPQLSKNNQREKGKNWSRVSDRCLTPRRTGRLTVGRNITLTLTWALYRRPAPALARPSSNRKLRTRPIVSEGAPHQQTRNCLKII
jgi:hypothetical protein